MRPSPAGGEETQGAAGEGQPALPPRPRRGARPGWRLESLRPINQEQSPASECAWCPGAAGERAGRAVPGAEAQPREAPGRGRLLPGARGAGQGRRATPPRARARPSRATHRRALTAGSNSVTFQQMEEASKHHDPVLEHSTDPQRFSQRSLPAPRPLPSPQICCLREPAFCGSFV